MNLLKCFQNKQTKEIKKEEDEEEEDKGKMYINFAGKIGLCVKKLAIETFPPICSARQKQVRILKIDKNSTFEPQIKNILKALGEISGNIIIERLKEDCTQVM